ncbi:MAG: T9SS type A sorting domain-containing protein [Bacteroidales bacterium]|nr:T9SS type A sorting domain-containing protein [Bacteroidales bacterium]
MNDSVGEYLHYFTPFYAPEFGMFFPIVDYVELIVTSADTTMGTAGPVAHVARNTSQTIWATRRRGYKFSHWQEDLGIHATRSVYITRDTTRFTAVFQPAARYTVQGMSDAEGAGYVTLDDSVYYEGDTAVLEAFAAEGMKFRYWSNGSTENPLRIAVESDTVVMAHFTELERYRVIGVSNDRTKGYVEVDDSIHLEDDTATLAAFAEAGYEFSSWSTGGTENPLRIVVESDTVVMAFFAGNGVGVTSVGDEGRPFTLSPNPARGRVTVELAESAAHGVMLKVQDAAGREVLRCELAAGTRTLTIDVAELPSGTYFVTLTTAKGTSTQKLVIN